MKTKSLMTSLMTLASAVLVAGSAQALTIAGWDFSQYLAPGLLTVDGSNGADTLPANYSNLDPTFSAGAESAAHGTMYINGQFGSTAVDPFAATPAVVPLDPSLVSNVNAPVGGAAGAVPFDSYNVLLDEGQIFANSLAMLAQSPVDLVFQATLTDPASDWGITLGGKTLSGTALVGVSVSLDGTTYGAPTLLSFDTNDKPFEVLFPSITADTIFVRLDLPVADGQPIIDNVSINATAVPEPASLVLLGLGLAGVAIMRRHRSA